MRKFFLKSRLILSLSTLSIVSLTLNTPIHAAITTGTLSQQEIEIVTRALSDIGGYTEEIRKVTGNLFTGTSAFQQDFATLSQLAQKINSIHAGISPQGSQLSQALLIHLKGIAHHLNEAQKKWIETLKTKSLITMGRNRHFMNTRRDDCLRFLLGAKRGRRYSGEGLIGHLSQGENGTLRSEAEVILSNVEFIFNYAQATRKKEADLAVHLIKHKGFSPRFIKQIAWLLS